MLARVGAKAIVIPCLNPFGPLDDYNSEIDQPENVELEQDVSRYVTSRPTQYSPPGRSTGPCSCCRPMCSQPLPPSHRPQRRTGD